MKKVVVIGSGLAGTLIGNDLVRDHDVTVLEVGKSKTYDYPAISYVRKSYGAVKTFCYGGGGTTNIWHNGLIPMRTGDISDERFAEVVQDAARYADEAASRLFYPGTEFTKDHDSHVTRVNGVAAGLGNFPLDMDCLIYPKSYRRLQPHRSVNTRFSVSDLTFDTVNGRVVRVNTLIGDSKESFEADCVVISAGALGSPMVVTQVLSDLGLSERDVGIGLADHPIGFVGKVRLNAERSAIFRTFSGSDCGGYECCSAVRVESDGYRAAAYFRPALTMQNRLEIYKYKSRLGASSGIRQLKAAASPKLFHPDVLAEVYTHLFRTTLRSRVFNVLLFFEQKRGEYSVTRRNGVLTVDWGVSDTELKIFNRILESLKDALAPMSEQVEIKIPITEDWLWSGAHHSGTVAMGQYGDGTIDGDLRINECDNVYVCDGSVIQEHSYANTGLTIGELALRVANTIRNV